MLATATGNAGMERSVMAARGLCMTFSPKGARPVNALDGLTLAAQPGRVTGIVGPDGAGKTTLMRIAAGMLMPTAGHMTVLGADVATGIDSVRDRIGYMPQQFGLYEDLTVQENLDFYADLQGVPPSERTGRYAHLMHMTGLEPFTDRQAGRLSGGMKQKLGLACCLVKSPGMLILDEPTVGVDPLSRRDLWDIVYTLVERDGIGVVLTTAYLDEAERCHHVALLHEGKLLDEGPPDWFYRRVRQRVYLVTPASGMKPRDALSSLAGRTDVIDATISCGRIRTVFRQPASGLLPTLPDGVASGISPVRPVFEDAFVDRLVSEGAGRKRDWPADGLTEAPPLTGDPTVVVRVAGLTKRFGAFAAVQGIGFEVRRGEIFGLLGANGAGKTTTFRMLCGLLPASSGEITVAGRDLRHSPAEARTRLGYMAQKFSLYRQLSVESNLRFYGKAYGLGRKTLGRRIDWALDEFDLKTRRRLPAGSLPGGYRQRLAMAAAMLHEPDILFLDEPTSGADPLARREFWLRISGFARSGVTVIVTTHFMEEAEFCDHMIIMAHGRTLAKGTPTEIRSIARSEANPDPTIEDAFIALTDERGHPQPEAFGNG
ncbi:ABC transporter ATP-binding protein [Desulfosarcina ovata subsp. ovata]|uniref:ABC transporter ATP-binding protein n=2 Tax=Desulfosarcina ovata TaxID=83564 RepID=A0A5K8A9N1_9BACT|nr:ABC transporter ATP-binding protein [Desulfosarcina ovata subsp. ovata]